MTSVVYEVSYHMFEEVSKGIQASASADAISSIGFNYDEWIGRLVSDSEYEIGVGFLDEPIDDIPVDICFVLNRQIAKLLVGQTAPVIEE